MGALPLIKEDPYYTYADYKEWELDEGERFELMNGEAYAMSAPSTIHQIVSRELFGQFYNYLKDKPCQAFYAPYDVRLFYEKDESDDTVLQPDLVVVCDPEKLGKEGYHGAPNLVIEILSPSNSVIEMYSKLELYESAGVPEYWVIDPQKKVVKVFRLNKDRYESILLEADDTLESTMFPGFVIPLETLFASAS